MHVNRLSAKLKFLKWQALYDTERPFQIFINIPAHVKDQRTTNLVYEDVDVQIADVRSHSENFDLDKDGFRYLTHTTTLQDFSQRQVVEDRYLPEIEKLLRKHVEDVDRVYFFDWRVSQNAPESFHHVLNLTQLRKNAPEIEGSIINLNDLTNWLRPALHVHVGKLNDFPCPDPVLSRTSDQSPSAVLQRIQLQLNEDSEFLLQGRIRVIKYFTNPFLLPLLADQISSVWRPLNSVVQDYPLAVCAGSTVDHADLVEADHIRRQYMGSTMYLQHNPEQKFYYMSNQTSEDVLIFKNFDSDRRVPAQCETRLSSVIEHQLTPRSCSARVVSSPRCAGACFATGEY